jgi:hypothetical protein
MCQIGNLVLHGVIGVGVEVDGLRLVGGRGPVMGAYYLGASDRRGQLMTVLIMPASFPGP